MDTFKTDKEYGYVVNLEDGRPFQEGYDVGLSADDTDVTALQKIFDAYLDTSSPEKTVSFIEHKLDFCIKVIDTMTLILKGKIQTVSDQLNEVQHELDDISHRMSKAYLVGKTFTTKEKLEMFDLQQELVIQRRNLKDTLVAMRVVNENFEKSRNFIFGMNRRQYSPKSARFREDEEYYCESKEQILEQEQEETSVTVTSQN
jgi:hypothetical protein